MKDRKREIVIMSVQILLCAVYVIFQFAQEAKSMQKRFDNHPTGD